MKEIQVKEEALFLPFMQIPSGHHHVADALMYELQNCKDELYCDKVDILSYSYGRIEKLVSSTYLTWIKLLPDVYNWLYYQSAYKKVSRRNRNHLYETLFMYFFKRLMNEKNPTILFCTHCLPSNIAGVLKQQGKLNNIVVNVYTDFFVNRVWGLEGIDYHFAPSLHVKDHLLEQGVLENRIYVTGIPVHPAFNGNEISNKSYSTKEQPISVLVTGGNLGVGTLEKLVTNTDGQVHYYVLCGTNEALYHRLCNEENSLVTPLPYITSRMKMNRLYDKVDAVITKPGGVTISECLKKGKPTFVYNPLPGQERINVEQLEQLGVIMPLDKDSDVEQQVLRYFQDSAKQNYLNQKIQVYNQSLESKSITTILEEIINKKIKH
ncbi:glycosyltransferase [Virgibacillus byunsanensis]|uniref:Glycosyltransferase n=1 Tax=Virgibacillus byunsanensis TaxID=570945 RepID=A0ABW3LNM5_9BACI